MAATEYWADDQILVLGSVDVSGTNSTTAYEPGEEIDIKRIFWAVTTAVTGTDATITLTKRDVDGSTASASQGTFPVAAAAVNTLGYVDLAKPDGTAQTVYDGSVVHDSTPDIITVQPHEEFLLTSGGQASQGVVTFFAEVQRKGLNVLSADFTIVEASFTEA